MQKIQINVNGTPRTLGIKLSLFRGKHKIYLDSELIGEFSGNKEAKEGKEFKIDYSNFVTVRYATKFLSPELYIALNGKELEASTSHPTNRKKTAFGLIIFLAVINLLMGVLAASNTIPAMAQAGYGGYNIFMGFFYCVAIVLFRSFNPMLGILLALILYSIDSAIVVMTIPGNPGLSGAIIVRIMFFGILIQGLMSSFNEFKLIMSKR